MDNLEDQIQEAIDKSYDGPEGVDDTIIDQEGEDSFSFDDFRKNIESHILHLTKEAKEAPQNMKEEWQAFTSAISWNEKWIQSIFIFHGILLILVLLFRKNLELQMGIFAIICALVFSSEAINTLASEQWESFSNQNYFDNRGVFMGTIICAPLLTISFIILVNLLIMASSALITSKRMKLKLDAKKKNKDKDKAE